MTQHTDHTPPTQQQLDDDRAIQVLSDQGAQCGDCGDQPGDRVCPDCERCRGWYVAALRKAGWAPQPEHDALVAEVRRLRARTLTPSEYNTAWHAVEGAAGEEGADPGTVLHAVLDRLGIEWQVAAHPAAASAARGAR